MNPRQTRLDTIRYLISSREVYSQEELLALLEAEHVHVTQATLSRDLKQMKIMKAMNNSGMRVYVLPNNTQYRRVRGEQSAQEMKQQNGFLSLRFCGNIGVIKTRPGYASALAYVIDNAADPAIVGTIAGDDTIFIAISEGTAREYVRSAISKMLIE